MGRVQSGAVSIGAVVVVSVIGGAGTAAAVTVRPIIAQHEAGTAVREHMASAGSAQTAGSGVAEPGWSTGACPGFLPGGTVGPLARLAADPAWSALEQQAIGQTEALYGQNTTTNPDSDPSDLYAEAKAREVTRAFMFADLLTSIEEVDAGKGTANEKSVVSDFQRVVQYEREWIAIEAINLWNSYTSGAAYESVITNQILQTIFAAVGLPWQNESATPDASELLNQAQGEFWGAPLTTNDGSEGDIENYPLASAESSQALHEAQEALSFLNAIGQTAVQTPGGGTDSTLDATMQGVENALGSQTAGLGDSIEELSDLGASLAGGDDGEEGLNTGLIGSLVNVVWTAESTLETNVQLMQDEVTAFQTPDLASALSNPTEFSELFQGFVATTLHTLPGGLATGNDPDCRVVNKPPSALAPAPDATFTVAHYSSQSRTGSFYPDYDYSTQTLGGNAPGTTGPSVPSGVNALNDPSLIDWSYARDEGPGAPRIFGTPGCTTCTPVGGQWPISQISMGVPGSAQQLRWGDPSRGFYYPVSGYFYITFTGANGTSYQTAPLHVNQDSSGKSHPTDSEVEQAIADADPTDFPTAPCGSEPQDPAVPPGDQTNGPCFAWNPDTGYGTDLIVTGSNHDSNDGFVGENNLGYPFIYDIMAKGDLDGWVPQFVGHAGQGPPWTATDGFDDDICDFRDYVSVAGPCVAAIAIAGIPLGGDLVETRQLWTKQGDDLCGNDPRTCAMTASYGWASPYPVRRECQAVSPADAMFDIRYVPGTVDPSDLAGSCANPPADASWTLTPFINYRSVDGSLWTAWRVPPTVGSVNFLSIEAAQHMSGQASIDDNCAQEQNGSQNAVCLVGQGTHWTSEFHSGDTILLQEGPDGQGQRAGLGGMLSAMRTVQTVVDDTHMVLGVSLECGEGSDGNNCVIHNDLAYNSFMNPADGSLGPDPSASPPTFDIYKMTGINPGTQCSVWAPSNDPHPPTTGCYYSYTLQFQSQTAASDGQNSWWNLSLPPSPATARDAAARPRAALDTLEPWLGRPIVTEQPRSALLKPGENATFTGAASGSPTPTVQWQRWTESTKKWADVPGATARAYTVNGVTDADSGNDYRAVFTNVHGSATSDFASLGVLVPPAITSSPASILSPKRGETITLGSGATGEPQPAATWQFSMNGGLTWTSLGGIPSRLTLRWFPQGTVTPLVRVVYGNQAGSATTMPAIVGPSSGVPHVKPQLYRAPAISGNPLQGQVLSSSRGRWWAVPSQLVYRYRWQRCARTCVAITGATGETYRIVAADRGASLRLQVTAANAKGATQAVSSRLAPVVTIAQLRIRLAAILSGAKRARIHALLARSGYRFLLVTPSTGRLVISWSTDATRHTKSVLIATLSTVLRAVGRTPLEVTLTPKGRRLLNKAKVVNVVATVMFTPAHYHAINARARFTLKR